MKLFSERHRLAVAVERKMLKDERSMSGIIIARCHFSTITYLDRMGWLRERPLRPRRS